MRRGVLMIGLFLTSLLHVHVVAAGSFAPVYEAGHGVLQETMCIGDDESDEYMFVRPDVVVDDAGNMFVLDRKLYNVREYDGNLEWVRTFSGLGEGPGQMSQYGVRMAVLRSGGVVLSDFGNGRLTQFAADGTYVRDTKLEPMTNVYRMESGADGALFVERQDISPEYGTAVIRILRYNGELRLVGTVDTLSCRQVSISELGSEWIEYRLGMEWVVTPQGELVIARNDEYKLRVYSPTLALVRTMERTMDRVPVAKADKKRFVEASKNDTQREMRRTMTLPDYKPCIRGLRCDSDGYLLVCLPDEMDTDTHYDVFDPDGEYVGSATLPPLKKLSVLKNGLVYCVESSEDAPPRVCRGSLVAASAN